MTLLYFHVGFVVIIIMININIIIISLANRGA